mgnify:CR=1 FL=1
MERSLGAPGPNKMIHWQLMARRGAAEIMKRAAEEGRDLTQAEQGKVRMMGYFSHIGTLITSNPEGVLNSASKGVLMLPSPQWLEWAVERLGDILEKQYGTRDHTGAPQRPSKEVWDAAANDRAQFLLDLYQPERIHPGAFGVLEIFQQRTYENIRANPVCALHFSGMSGERGRGYQSFQVNCRAEIVTEGLELRFMKDIKLMMDYYGSHVPQAAYGCGYILNVESVLDKAPFPQVAGRHLNEGHSGGHGHPHGPHPTTPGGLRHD